MELVHPQLTAFTAVLEEGSFEAAARRLAITPSAMSQRIKALEDRLGQVLVVRQAPCRPTPAGERLLRRVRPMQALEAEALAELLPDQPAMTSHPIAIAVNDDSLATWFVGAVSRLHEDFGYLLDVRVDDQDHTLAMLRDGSVLGAIASDAAPLQGCSVRPLGTMRYRAIASPAFAAKHFKRAVDAESLATAPMIVFNRKDDLQSRFMRRITRARLAPPVHYLPSSTGTIQAAARGLGWCLGPEALIGAALRDKAIAIVDHGHWLDVPLYWHHAAVRSTTIERVTKAVRDAASAALR